MNRTAELAQLLQAAKTVLGKNASNQPTPAELQNLYYAVCDFESATNFYPSEKPNAPHTENNSVFGKIYREVLTLRGKSNDILGGLTFSKEKTVELQFPTDEVFEIRIPIEGDLTDAVKLLRLAADWLSQYSDFFNLEKVKLTAKQVAHNETLGVFDHEIPF